MNLAVNLALNTLGSDIQTLRSILAIFNFFLTFEKNC